jgi:hypothetical protein
MKPYFNRGIFTRLQNPTLFQAVRVVRYIIFESQPVAAETIDSLIAENSLN